MCWESGSVSCLILRKRERYRDPALDREVEPKGEV